MPYDLRAITRPIPVLSAFCPDALRACPDGLMQFHKLPPIPFNGMFLWDLQIPQDISLRLTVGRFMSPCSKQRTA